MFFDKYVRSVSSLDTYFVHHEHREKSLKALLTYRPTTSTLNRKLVAIHYVSNFNLYTFSVDPTDVLGQYRHTIINDNMS